MEKMENRLSEYFSSCLPNHILGFISILNTAVAAKELANCDPLWKGEETSLLLCRGGTSLYFHVPACFLL